MKIPKLFKKAAAFVMAAVTALSIMPATAFAAGDIGTISFSHTYDSNGNAMRYNSSANIGGYTAGGTGNYKYRMFVDGENAFCIQPGVPLKTGNTLKKASSDTWNALSANQKKAVGLALLYGYQGNRNNLSGSDDEKWLATQTLVWEFVTGCREATGSYNQTSTTVYSLHFGSNYANSGARAVYDQIVAMLREHNTIPSFMSGGKNDITKELVSALIDASPVSCVPVGELELPAYYDSSQQTIFVKKGLSEEVLFMSMAKEVSAAVYDFKYNESRDVSDFKSFCVAYMVSSRYGMDTRGFDFSRLPREYAEMDTQAFKGELGTMRDVLGEIQSDMYKSMEKNKPAKNKEQER